MKTTKKLLEEMGALAFGIEYQENICGIYQADVDAGKYDIEEGEYVAAKAALPDMLSTEKSVLLDEFEEVCRKIREYSASYGFTAGIFCGFKQYFTNDHEADGGFTKTVVDDVAMQPKMQRHQENYANIERRNELGRQLDEGESEKVKEHLVSISCTWSQRAHSASLNGFYCGYRAALEIIEKVTPFSCCKVRMAGKILSMENWLGYTKPYEEQERLQERRTTEQVC